MHSGAFKMTQFDPLRVGLIGAGGRWGPRAHVPAHYELSKNAIEAGKHVFCEWPFGANTKEAEELAALARKKNLRTMVGLQRRASRAYLYMRELIQEGYVGEVLSVNMMLMGSGAGN